MNNVQAFTPNFSSDDSIWTNYGLTLVKFFDGCPFLFVQKDSGYDVAALQTSGICWGYQTVTATFVGEAGEYEVNTRFYGERQNLMKFCIKVMKNRDAKVAKKSGKQKAEDIRQFIGESSADKLENIRQQFIADGLKILEPELISEETVDFSSMSWDDLRAYAQEQGVKAGGLGRTKSAIIADLENGTNSTDTGADDSNLVSLSPEEDNMQFVNLTPHIVKIADSDGNIVLEIPTSGNNIRLDTETVVRQQAEVDGVSFPIRATTMGGASLISNETKEVVGPMPEPQDGVFLIVSGFVQSAFPKRNDLVRPDTGPDAVRVDGRIEAVRALTF